MGAWEHVKDEQCKMAGQRREALERIMNDGREADLERASQRVLERERER